MSPTAEEFRACAARLPAGVGVLVVAWRGALHATTVGSAVSLSLDPPLLGVAVHVDSRVREALADEPTWTLSVLGDGQAGVADWLGSPGRPVVGQLDRVPTAPAVAGSAVRVLGAAAWFDARTVAVHGVGDHDLVVGEVLAAGQGASDVGALVHLRGRLRPVR